MEILTLETLPKEIPWKYKLAYLSHMLENTNPVKCPLVHIFDGDKYIREMRIPAGTLFIGRTHLNGHVVQLVSGEVRAVTEEGNGELKAPFEFRSVPGYQAVFYADTDVIGRTVHENPLGITDWQILEERDFEQIAPILARGKMVAEQLKELPCQAE